jgi:hypothetical protein
VQAGKLGNLLLILQSRTDAAGNYTVFRPCEVDPNFTLRRLFNFVEDEPILYYEIRSTLPLQPPPKGAARALAAQPQEEHEAQGETEERRQGVDGEPVAQTRQAAPRRAAPRQAAQEEEDERESKCVCFTVTDDCTCLNMC